MITEFLQEFDDVVGIVCDGELTRKDLVGIHALLNERLAATSEPGLVVDLTRFTGYSDLGVFVADSRMNLAHRNDFSRIAIIGQQRWTELGTALASLLTRAEMRWFDTNRVDLGADWARRG
ncbi:STAS/SEC14 domain-containing protein (plasmid) [Acuticoccus sp. MNP-M23]|uniref:STAS/SEC14 domain-containing protein n=1 Tax=Acuticoccus sp. MNP-M23 TaxID=3072793 RepID=UPI002814CF04|nr:STAS/SEC14 domain-containing protein [Acuticoccus sp. MNP-M23]WMS45193.1 STAS/SEC14 domain-containing protein [Acuticoccus sp. MNP-M23]